MKTKSKPTREQIGLLGGQLHQGFMHCLAYAQNHPAKLAEAAQRDGSSPLEFLAGVLVCEVFVVLGIDQKDATDEN